MYRYLFTLFLLGTALTTNGQDYRYLQILIDTADNFHFVEMEWFDEGVSHPQAMTAHNAPAPLLVTGDNANWNLFRIYDDNFTNSSYVNEVLSSPEFTREFTLDLGAGNSLRPDSIRITKPDYSVLAAFRILLSEDGINWDLYLDTTRNHTFSETLVFPLNLVVDSEPPTTPPNLTSDCINAEQIALAWTAATDNYRVTQYHIYQNGTLIDSTQTTRFAVQNLSANTNYNFQVYALDKARNHSIPATISVTTDENDSIAPTMSGNLEVINLSAHTATIRWAAATDNRTINGYLVQLDSLTIGSTADTVFSIGGLDTLTTYSVQVVAKDGAQHLSNALQTQFRTLMDNGRTKIGTNFWNQHWSPENNQLFVNGYQNVTGDNPWKPELLAELDYAQTLRYMEMQQINQVAAQPTYRWLDRKKKTNVLQDEIAYEWMIDLCNRKNANLWVCLPDQIISRDGVLRGRENYIKKLAILLKTG
ncbi:MAG: fibronectin type III domain-containing protein, partial [Bacteroidota bacterium]